MKRMCTDAKLLALDMVYEVVGQTVERDGHTYPMARYEHDGDVDVLPEAYVHRTSWVVTLRCCSQGPSRLRGCRGGRNLATGWRGARRSSGAPAALRAAVEQAHILEVTTPVPGFA